MKKKNEKESVKDSLLEDLAKEINKSAKDGSVSAHFLDEQTDSANVSDWVSTGSSMLDLAISNRPNGGLPVGRIVEFTGLEQCVTEDTIVEVIIN
jgi:RecA/RadA recombinase